MSRLIVKNLPNGMKEDRFKSMFAAFGTVTDCSLKFTKDGKFRKFGFVGFKSEEDANSALSHFNKSFVDTSRVTVEMCKAFGDPTKARAWSKHSQGPGAEKPSTAADTDSKKKKKQKKEANSTLENLEKDQEFKEFLSVHQKRGQAPTWANDVVQAPGPDAQQTKSKGKKSSASDDYLNFDSDDSEEEGEESDLEEEDEDEGATKEALMSELSDMDYLRSKVAKADTAQESKDKKDDEEVEDDDADEDSGSAQHPDSAYESGENAAKTKPSASSKNKMQSKDKKNAQQEVTVEEEP